MYCLRTQLFIIKLQLFNYNFCTLERRTFQPGQVFNCCSVCSKFKKVRNKDELLIQIWKFLKVTYYIQGHWRHKGLAFKAMNSLTILLQDSKMQELKSSLRETEIKSRQLKTQFKGKLESKVTILLMRFFFTRVSSIKNGI